MALQFYADLLASVADWLQRGDLTPVIPDFVALAEAEISRRLVIGGAPRNMYLRCQTPINDEFKNVPSDFMGARSFWLQGATAPLEFVDPEKIIERKVLYPNVDAGGNTVVYAVVGNSFQFWPVPQSEVIGELLYIARVQSLNDSITANWLLTLHPDCYLYGSLLQAAPYLKDDDRVQLWQAKFDGIISSICEAGKRGLSAPQLALPQHPYLTM